jgi:hypothetical protein
MFNCYSNTKQRRPIKVGNKVVGYLEGDRFIKLVIGSKHKLRCPPAWCLAASIFEQLVISSIQKIEVQDKEANLPYRTSIDNFARNCFPIQRGSFEKQLALPLKKWTIEGNGNRQLSLWGGESNA